MWCVCVEIGKLIKPKKRPTRDETSRQFQTNGRVSVPDKIRGGHNHLQLHFWVQSSVYTRRLARTHIHKLNLGYSTVL